MIIFAMQASLIRVYIHHFNILDKANIKSQNKDILYILSILA